MTDTTELAEACDSYASFIQESGPLCGVQVEEELRGKIFKAAMVWHYTANKNWQYPPSKSMEEK